MTTKKAPAVATKKVPVATGPKVFSISYVDLSYALSKQDRYRGSQLGEDAKVFRSGEDEMVVIASCDEAVAKFSISKLEQVIGTIKKLPVTGEDDIDRATGNY